MRFSAMINNYTAGKNLKKFDEDLTELYNDQCGKNCSKKKVDIIRGTQFIHNFL